jgi:electron transfer flavoprotein alpha subunit
VDGNVIVFPHTTDASSVAPMLAISKGASLITNVIAAPESISPFQVKEKLSLEKVICMQKQMLQNVVITVSQNAFGVKENPVQVQKKLKTFCS